MRRVALAQLLGILIWILLSCDANAQTSLDCSG